MLEIYLATLLLVAASALVGRAVWRLCGNETTPPLAPAVGVATLFALAAAAVQLPGHAVTAGVLVLAVVAASTLVPGLRADLRAALPDGLVVGVAGLALVSLPFWVSGRAGVLGVGDNNDMSFHMTTVYWLQTHAPEAATRAAVQGYPLGPHSIVAGLGSVLRLSIPGAFTGLMLAVPILVSYTALAPLGRLPAPARWAAALFVGFVYLAASYYAQGAFKENLQALFVVAFALCVRELVQRGGPTRRAVPLGLLASGMIAVYSFFGLLWPLAALGVLFVLEVARSGRAPAEAARELVARSKRFAYTAIVVVVAVTATESARIVDFVNSRYAHQPENGTGNLHGPISPLQAFGVWLTGDFRFDPPSKTLDVAFAALCVACVIAAFGFLVRRRELVLPAALTGSFLVYWQATIFKNPYNAAKALAIVSPLVALVLVAAFANAERRRRLLVPLAVAVGVPCAFSSFYALRDGLVGPRDHERALAAFRPLIQHEPVLFLGKDDFVWWELRGARVGAPPALYSTWALPLRERKPQRGPDLFDFDSMASGTLDEVRYVVEPRSPYASSAPENFRLRRTNRWFRLWERVGPTPERRILRETGAPGAVLDCSVPADRSLSRREGFAAVRPAPVVRPAEAWSGTARTAGATASVRLPLGRGVWDVALQYVSREGYHFQMPGLETDLAANLDRLGPYWRVGTVRVAKAGVFTATVRARDVTAFGRLVGARGLTLAFSSPYSLPLGSIVATRHAAPVHVIPLRRACGRYVDWYRLR